jgi:hypothetical protein
MAVAEVVEVAGDLALKEHVGVRAAYGEDAFVAEGAIERGIGHGGLGIAG